MAPHGEYRIGPIASGRSRPTKSSKMVCNFGSRFFALLSRLSNCTAAQLKFDYRKLLFLARRRGLNELLHDGGKAALCGLRRTIEID